MTNNKFLHNSQVIPWLEKHAIGFSELTETEYQTIMEFSLLWSLFEGEALETRGNANKIQTAVNKWANKGSLKLEKFEESLKYFVDRYFHNGEFTKNFNSLNFRSCDNEELVKQVLAGNSDNPVDRVTALLIIVYRLRNNLFHGTKWANELKDQLANFQHANAALMAAIEIHRFRPRKSV